MPNPPSFYAWATQTLAPAVFRRPWGQKLLATLAFGFDATAADANTAVLSRLADQCPDDALPYVGQTLNLERYRVETDDEYRSVLESAWEFPPNVNSTIPLGVWGKAGTADSIVYHIKRLGYANAEVIPYRVAATLTPEPPTRWTVPTPWWSAFWVAIWPNPFTQKHWGSPPKWGAIVPSVVGNPPGRAVWGSNMNEYDVRELRGVVHKWKPAHEICAAVVFKADAGTALFDPANVQVCCTTASQ